MGISRYHLLGQSWGGMLGAEIAVRKPEGLVSLSICNSPASMDLWVEGAAELRAQLPPETQDALARHEAAGTVSDPEYLAATMEFYRRLGFVEPNDCLFVLEGEEFTAMGQE